MAHSTSSISLQVSKPRSRYLWILFALALAAVGIFFKDWIALGYRALRYPTTASGQPANVVAMGRYAYASLAQEGLGVYDMNSGQRIRTLSPPPGSESIDDLALADGFLFVLDGRIPGALSVLSLEDPADPQWVSAPLAVEVEPFSGVAAEGGNVVVSGGTSQLSLHRYDAQGKLSQNFETADFGRGQPEILLAKDGKHAVVSTHYRGPQFGLTTIEISPSGIQQVGGLALEGAGFSAGGAKPGNFPMQGAWADEILLLAYGRGLAFVDLHDWTAPRLRQTLDVGVKAVHVDVLGSTAAVVGSQPNPRLVLIDISDLNRPKIIQSMALPTGTLATGVAFGRDKVAVAGHGKELLFYPIHP